MSSRKSSASGTIQRSSLRVDPLTVQSVEKAFRVLTAFDAAQPRMRLTQIAATVGLDKSAAQRFTHTLTKLGYLRKDGRTKLFELTARTLDFGYHYIRASALIERALPYLLDLSKTTEETINLTVLDDTEIVFIARFMSRHVLNADMIVGTRLPAYCAAPGIAILSRLPNDETQDILKRSNLKPYTPHTTYRMNDLLRKIKICGARGYATAFEEVRHGDLTVAAAIVDQNSGPLGAINVAVPLARFSPTEVEEKFSSLVVAAAQSISRLSHQG